MKRFILSLSLIMIFTIIASCEQETILSVDQTSISVPEGGGSQSVSLTANKPWSATASQTWCHISPSGGEEASSSKILITCDFNTTYEARNCAVTFTCEEKSVSVSVSQEANHGLIISKGEYDISNAAQSIDIEVKANVKFDVIIDDNCKSWIKHTGTKALSQSTVTLDISPNTTYSGREGMVTIKQVDGALSSSIVIRQKQMDGLIASKTDYSVTSEKQSLEIDVQTNVDLEVSSDVEWIHYTSTKALTAKAIIVEVDANYEKESRSGHVTVKQKGADLSAIITISQDAMRYLEIAPSELTVSSSQHNETIVIDGNVDYQIFIPDNDKQWISFDKSSGSGKEQRIITISENTKQKERTSVIIIKNTTYGLSCSLSITQNAPKAKITLSVEAGGLKKAFEDLGINYLDVQELTISGRLNGDDMAIIRTMAGNDKYFIQEGDEPSKGSMEVLDMSNIVLVPGNEIYAYHYGSNLTISSSSEIPYDMFRACPRLRKVILPNSCMSLGNGAFFFCESLETVIVSKSLYSIGASCFAGCNKLKQMDLPSVVSIDRDAFSNCNSLIRIDVPNLQSISEGAFAFCPSLETIIIDSDNPYFCVEDNALLSKDKTLLYCYPGGLGGTYITPSTVEQVRSYAFVQSHLDKLVLTDNVRVIADYVCYHSQIESVILPNNLVSMGCIFMTNNERLKHIELCGKITYVPTIHDCPKLEEIDIPEGVTTITAYGNGSYCFNGCTALRKIALPSTLTRIDHSTFNRTVIVEVHCKSVEPQKYDNYPFQNDAIIYVPKGSKSKYEADSNWGKYKIVEE